MAESRPHGLRRREVQQIVEAIIQPAVASIRELEKRVRALERRGVKAPQTANIEVAQPRAIQNSEIRPPDRSLTFVTIALAASGLLAVLSLILFVSSRPDLAFLLPTRSSLASTAARVSNDCRPSATAFESANDPQTSRTASDTITPSDTTRRSDGSKATSATVATKVDPDKPLANPGHSGSVADPNPAEFSSGSPTSTPQLAAVGEPQVASAGSGSTTSPDLTDTRTQSAAAGARPKLTRHEIYDLIARGDMLLASGDFNSARAFYERAAAFGDSEAALRLGASYDPGFLTQAGLNPNEANISVATRWYGLAQILGAPEAEILLKALVNENRAR